MALAALVALLCGCSKEAAETGPSVPETPQEIRLIAVADAGDGAEYAAEGDAWSNPGGTRALTTGAELPDSYTIFTTVYNTDDANPEMTGNFATCLPFSKREGSYDWHGNPPLFWPLGGTLDFFAVATEPEQLGVKDASGDAVAPFDMAAHATWAERRNTDGVMIDVPDYDGSTEILYGVRNGLAQANGTVPMTFYHTQVCLEFNVRVSDAALENLLRIDRIVVNDIITGGRLTILTYPFINATWDITESSTADRIVPGSVSTDEKPIDVTAEPKSFRIVLLPQKGRTFRIYFRQRANIAAEWSERSVSMSFEYGETTEQEWYAERKYIYNITLGIHGIEIDPHVVQDWSASIDDVTV